MTMKQLLRNYTARKDGQSAIIFGLILVPILAVAGFAIDFQLTAKTKQSAQAIVDAAVLSGARSIQGGETTTNAETMMIAQVKERISHQQGATCSDLKVTFTNNNKDILGTLDCKQKTTLTAVIGRDEIDLKIEATSTWDLGNLDIAFMFDVSGSMNTNGRLTKLKAAANEAVDILLPVGSPGDKGTRIAMVAYDDMVNAGDLFEDVTGLKKKRTYKATDHYRERSITNTESVWKEVCTYGSWYCTEENSDGVCLNSTRDKTCEHKWADEHTYEWGESKTRELEYEIDSTCVWERNGNEAFTDAAPTGNISGFPAIVHPVSTFDDAYSKVYNASPDPDNGHGYMAAGYAYISDNPNWKDGWRTDGISCSNSSVQPLTKTRSKLTSYISGLSANGGTAGHQGIAWAWYTIAQPWQTVFKNSEDPLDYDAEDTTKALILMTDGDFLDQEFNSELGSSDTQARAICDEIRKNANIKVFTIAFEAPTNGQQVLQYCATDPSMAYTASSGAQLTAAYQEIARSIAELRIKS